MAKISNSAFRAWKDGDVIKADQYKQEREMIRTAINDNHDKNDGVRQRVEVLEPEVASQHERLTEAEGALVQHDGRIGVVEEDLSGLDMRMVRETSARVEAFYLNNDRAMRPVTFGDLKRRNVTYSTLKHGYIRFYAFKMFRFEGGDING